MTLVDPLEIDGTSIYHIELNRPYFVNKLEDQLVLVGTAWSYTFPKPLHPSDLQVRLDVELGKAAVFVDYDESTTTLSIEED